MKITAITQARLGSTRFPSKIFEKINDKTLLEIQIDSLKKSRRIDNICIATTSKKEDQKIMDFSKQLGVSCFQGSEHDVLDRFYQASLLNKSDIIIRLTSDCPLLDYRLIDEMIEKFLLLNIDYYSNTLIENFPDGQDVEIFTYHALEKTWKESKILSDREHVTPYIKRNSDFLGGDKFKSSNHNTDEIYRSVRMTVDEKNDLEVIKILINELGFYQKWEQYAEHYLKHSRIHSINSSIQRNEGYKKSLLRDSKS